MRLRLNKNVELKDLEPFGFKNGIYERVTANGTGLYKVVITRNNKNIQVYTANGIIAGSLQCLIYDLTKANLVHKVED